MQFWKFQYLGDTSIEECIKNKSLPLASQPVPGLATTDQDVIARMRLGDGVVIAELVGDQAKLYAIGRVVSIANKQPEISWARSINFRFPDERGGLIHWQTKTAFEISSEPAKRYGLKDLVEHFFGK